MKTHEKIKKNQCNTFFHSSINNTSSKNTHKYTFMTIFRNNNIFKKPTDILFDTSWTDQHFWTQLWLIFFRTNWYLEHQGRLLDIHHHHHIHLHHPLHSDQIHYHLVEICYYLFFWKCLHGPLDILLMYRSTSRMHRHWKMYLYS